MMLIMELPQQRQQWVITAESYQTTSGCQQTGSWETRKTWDWTILHHEVPKSQSLLGSHCGLAQPESLQSLLSGGCLHHHPLLGEEVHCFIWIETWDDHGETGWYGHVTCIHKTLEHAAATSTYMDTYGYIWIIYTLLIYMYYECGMYYGICMCMCVTIQDIYYMSFVKFIIDMSMSYVHYMLYVPNTDEWLRHSGWTRGFPRLSVVDALGILPGSRRRAPDVSSDIPWMSIVHRTFES